MVGTPSDAVTVQFGSGGLSFSASDNVAPIQLAA